MRERLLKIPLQQLAAGRKTMLMGGLEGDKGVPFPAAIAVLGNGSGGEKLLVAENLSDDVLLMDAATGNVETVRSVGERCCAFDVSGGAGGDEGWDACVCGALECERGGGARPEEGHGRA